MKDDSRRPACGPTPGKPVAMLDAKPEQEPTIRVGLGTAQFGLEYGITNAAGRVDESTVAEILAAARDRGMDLLDTAHLYGRSETVLGRVGSDDFRIVTKTPKLAGFRDSTDAVATLRSAFGESLASLGMARIHGLLLHDAQDLLGPLGQTLWQAMRELREAGLVERIGVSVYDGVQIDRAIQGFDLDLVQLPLNPLDRRLIDGGQLGRLAERGVEVHARSLFLQGLILANPAKIPPWLDPVRSGVIDLQARFAAAGLSPIEGVFAWASGLPVDCFICGVTTVAELQDIASAAEKAQRNGPGVDLAGAPSIDPIYLNPAQWPALAAAALERSKRT